VSDTRRALSPKMAWSKSVRIKMMLAIDIVFFLLELSVGFLVGSLALMADAFHMVRTTRFLLARPQSLITNVVPISL
jgi:Co/Zn/Cd efflux system component